MKKVIPIENSRSLKKGDILVYTEYGVSKINDFTIGRGYPIQDFYDDKCGVVLTSDRNTEHQICNDLVKEYFKLVVEESDNVNHPPHYTWLKDKCGVEVIDITRHMDFCLGNAIKYILRAGHKQDASLSDSQKEVEDLKKAIFYINDRIAQIEGKYDKDK